MDIKMKKIGVVFTIIGIILMLFIVFVTILVYQYDMDDSPIMFSDGYYSLVKIDLLCFAVGSFCFAYKKLKKLSGQIKLTMETRKAEKRPAKKSIWHQKAPIPAVIRFQRPNVPDNVSRPQWIQSLYLCENIHPLVIIRYILGIIMMVGTLLSIPILANQLPPDYELAYITVATVLFWSGILIFVAARNNIKLQKTTGFVITMDGFLYYLSINLSIYQDSRIPLTKLGSIIYNSRKIQRISEVERTQEAFLNSKEAKEEIEECLNGKQVRDLFCITRIDAPQILRRNISNIKIKFWNEESNRVERITLCKNNKGFQQILSTINKLDQKINYKVFEKSLRNKCVRQ
ncbi:MAG: hypothetical protein E6600_11475 [Anaerocolumna aminovalerica]|uniref:hypothetical protein n=1 Tax=Anaerocolumna aminovalerica TaxID=1527 RepID=UPI002907E642|nr:hypothetical protein [Anaerocolumna aminovalerica]MDU6265108.1 hypothetical protein [Anaerocolumna aminovalerica]